VVEERSVGTHDAHQVVYDVEAQIAKTLLQAQTFNKQQII